MSKTSNDTLIQKLDFIKFISSSTPQEINEFIETNGKPPKLIDPIIFLEKIE